jgi:hypothetical protein
MEVIGSCLKALDTQGHRRKKKNATHSLFVTELFCRQTLAHPPFIITSWRLSETGRDPAVIRAVLRLIDHGSQKSKETGSPKAFVTVGSFVEIASSLRFFEIPGTRGSFILKNSPLLTLELGHWNSLNYF